MKGHRVTLTPAEVQAAIEQGTARHRNARRQSFANNYGFRPSGAIEDIDARGSIEDICARSAELAVFKLFGLFPGAFDLHRDIAHRHDGDVADYEVRHTRRNDGCLIIRPDDPDDRTYILAVGVIPGFRLPGWMYGAEGKREEWLRNPGGRPPAYFIPQSALREIDQLIEMHLRRQLGGGQ